MGNGGTQTGPTRWRARTAWSVALRAVVLLVPLGAGVGTAALISRMVTRPEGSLQLLWWLMLFGCSAAVTALVDRVARRLLPLAVLLRLTLLFPDRAPSRYAVARTAGNTRLLEQRVREARERGIDTDPTRAAETVLALVAALSAHDRQTRGHSERVRAYTDLLAGALKLPTAERDRLRWAALLHDIGKLEVPADILNKPGKPEPHEWETLKRHPEEGARLTGPLFPWLGEWGLAISQHHERFDGGGYPSGLAAERISMGGRILCVTDSFETMTAARSYKKPMSVAAARQELTRCAGEQFDPAIVRAFVGVSLGRLWWQVGPVSWVAQLPFISLRAASEAARAAAATMVQAAVGVAAIGAAGLTSLPPARAADRPPAVHGPVAATPVSSSAQDAADPATEDDGPGDEPDRKGDPGDRPGPGDGGGEDPDGGGGEPGGGDPGGGDPGGGDPGGGGPGGGGPGGGGPIDDVVDGVTDTVDDVVGGVGDTVDDVVGGVGDTVDDVVGGVGDAVGDVSDGLPGLGG